jgi:hypothetical protein
MARTKVKVEKLRWKKAIWKGKATIVVIKVRKMSYRKISSFLVAAVVRPTSCLASTNPVATQSVLDALGAS